MSTSSTLFPSSRSFSTSTFTSSSFSSSSFHSSSFTSSSVSGSSTHSSTFSATTSTLKAQEAAAIRTVRRPTAHVPLTTIFTPPARCTDLPYTFSTEHSGISTFYRDADGPGDRTACYPEGFRNRYNTTGAAAYSPGVCPSGYVGAQVEQTPYRQVFTSWCCPSDMSYAQSIGCVSTVTTPTVVALNSLTSVTMTTPFIAADWDVKVVWASSELNWFIPRSAPLLVARETNNVTYTPPPRNPPAEPDLSGGQMAGIVAPITVIFLAVFASGVYALWRRKRKRPYVSDTSGLIESRPMDEKDAGGSASANLARANTQDPVETSGEQRMSEDDSPSIRAALQGGWEAQEVPTGTRSG